MNVTPPKSTIVQIAGEDAKVFGDFVSKFVVSHPKTSAVLAMVFGILLGHYVK